MAELSRNKLHLLTAVSLASALSTVPGAQQGIQLLLSTAPASLFSSSSLPPATEGSPRRVFLLPIHRSFKEASKLGNKFRSNKRPWQSGQMYLIFSCCTSMTSVSAEPFGSNKLKIIFLAHSHAICLRKGLNDREIRVVKASWCKGESQAVHK